MRKRMTASWLNLHAPATLDDPLSVCAHGRGVYEGSRALSLSYTSSARSQRADPFAAFLFSDEEPKVRVDDRFVPMASEGVYLINCVVAFFLLSMSTYTEKALYLLHIANPRVKLRIHVPFISTRMEDQLSPEAKHEKIDVSTMAV